MHVFVFIYSPIGSWICPHTEKFKQTKKGLPKITFFIFHMQKWKKVQSVLKTDQRADVSAHAFFSTH